MFLRVMLSFLSLVLTVCLCAVDVVALSSQRESYALYRSIYVDIQKRYTEARKQRYSEPCIAKQQLDRYLDWLRELESQVENKPLRTHHRRQLLRNIRNYRVMTVRQQRWIYKNCFNYWKHELQRLNNRPNKRCQDKFAPSLHEKSAALWVGVSPWAYVYINDQLCGTAPLYANMRVGSYRIRLVYPPGQDEFSTTVQLSAGKTPSLVAHQMKTAPPTPRGFSDLLAPTQLRWVLERHTEAFRSCQIYQPEVSSVTLSWQIDPEGKSHDIQWVRPIDAVQRLRECVTRTLMRIRFPARKGTARIHEYTIDIPSRPSRP
jgi:hypothetical protein